MVLLDRLENNGLISFKQFGFKEGVGCTEASLTILDTINHMLESGNMSFWLLFRREKGFQYRLD